MRALIAALAGLTLVGGLALAQPKEPVDEDSPEVESESPTVKLTFKSTGGTPAHIYYGKDLLGVTPFTVDWKRDSGPVDIVARASGYVPVFTRAYTGDNDVVVIKMTPLSRKHTLFGYKHKDEPDAGAPAPAPVNEDAP